jgi:hypothetical protein
MIENDDILTLDLGPMFGRAGASFTFTRTPGGAAGEPFNWLP